MVRVSTLTDWSIPGYGDFQVAKIVKAPSRGANAMETDESLDVLPTENRETLDDLVPFDDDMMVEDEGYNGEFSAPGVRLDDHHYFRDEFREEYELEMKTRRLPKGMSDYQSKWIIDDELIDDEELSEDDFEDEEEMVDDNGEDDFGVSKTAPSEYGDMTEAGDMQSEMFLELSADEEERQLKEYRARARADLEFPDEVELPPNVSAKKRMSRYRGLKNLRSCTWDVEEKDPRAPEEWARLLESRTLEQPRTEFSRMPLSTLRSRLAPRLNFTLLSTDLLPITLRLTKLHLPSTVSLSTSTSRVLLTTV